ncbi:class II fructose-bisphosphate aldolase [Streptomyces sp. YIM S03343]
MPIATPEVYNEMLDRAKAGKFAYPAINVTSTQTLHAVLRGLSEAESDGIVQISTGGAEFLGGQYNRDMVSGAVGLAEFAHVVAEKYPVTVALHTDHCPKDKLDGYVRPLLAISEERVKAGRNPLFQSHMWDGSAETLADNLAIAQELLARAAAAKIILEVEITPTGGEEDGVSHEINDSLYTTIDDAVRTVEALGLGDKGRYLLAASFGNVHGVYKPGNVVLRPELLKELNEGIAAKYGKASPFDFVFHGGSGSTAEEIATALDNGVVKMNLDTDTQYAFTRPIVDHVFRNYNGVLKVDGEVGTKSTYDPRTWGKLAEAGMAARVVEATQALRSAGNKMK